MQRASASWFMAFMELVMFFAPSVNFPVSQSEWALLLATEPSLGGL